MSVDLIIMPLRNAGELKGHVLGFSRLEFDTDYRIFAQIANVEGKSTFPDEGVEAIVKTYSLPHGVKIETYESWGIKKGRKNGYGEEMVYTTAGEMKKIQIPKVISDRNKAIMAYIQALKKDTPIILEWS